MRIVLSQIDPTVGAIEQNKEKIIAEIEKAKKEEADLVIFPEMCLSGYPAQDLLFQKGFVDSCERALDEIKDHTSAIYVILGTPRKARGLDDKPFYNSAALLFDGKVVGFQDKFLLPTYDIFDERRYFRPSEVEKVWTIRDKKVGITICEDIWPFVQGKERYPKDPLSYFEKEPIDLLINISASPYSQGKIALRRELLQRVATRLSCPSILVNQVGGQDGILFDGSSLVVSKEGKLLYQEASFAEDHVALLLEDLSPCSVVTEGPAAELFFALAMGLRDYFVKQGFQKAIVGMSGGVDSSVSACVATIALGKENVLGVLLPSRFTSSESTEDALAVASNLGINTREIPIDAIFQKYLDQLRPIFDGDKLEIGETEENIQSRIRSCLLMALANK
jgi:NAD+ synthase (glutamine-hydrolysing)